MDERPSVDGRRGEAKFAIAESNVSGKWKEHQQQKSLRAASHNPSQRWKKKKRKRARRRNKTSTSTSTNESRPCFSRMKTPLWRKQASKASFLATQFVASILSISHSLTHSPTPLAPHSNAAPLKPIQKLIVYQCGEKEQGVRYHPLVLACPVAHNESLTIKARFSSCIAICCNRFFFLLPSTVTE